MIAPQSGVGELTVTDGELGFAADGDTVAALTVALGQARVGITRLVEQSATLEELFLGPRPAASRATRARGGACWSQSTAVYRWELSKLRAQKRTYLGLGAGMIVPDRVRRSRSSSGRAAPPTSPSAGTSATSGLAAPFVVLEFMSIWGLPADHRARRRRHRRQGEPQRHAEDDPHPLARARRGLRGQGARRRSPTPLLVVFAMGAIGARRRQASTGASTRSRRSPARRCRRGHGLVLLVGEPRRLPARPGRHRRLRAPALDRHAQQRGLGRRHADVRAVDAAARRPPRHREHPALPAQHPVRRLARLPAHACRLGAGGPRPLGLRPLHRRAARRRATSSSSAGTSQANRPAARAMPAQRSPATRQRTEPCRRHTDVSSVRERATGAELRRQGIAAMLDTARLALALKPLRLCTFLFVCHTWPRAQQGVRSNFLSCEMNRRSITCMRPFAATTVWTRIAPPS